MWQCDGEKDRKVRIFYVKEHKGEMNFVILSWNLVESAVDFSSPRNVFVAALILVIAIGVKYGANDDVAIGAVHISGLALSALVGIILNAVLPGGFGKTLKIYPDKVKQTPDADDSKE